MIKIDKLNKYYNKKASNEIHVINDVTLELPDKGLIAIFGTSGSGKTTLLNAISGLDKVDSGRIEIDGNVFDKYDCKQWDSLRNREIGYIFQNYNLIDDISVYENIDMALKLAGVANEKEREERIVYTLDLLGLLKYKKRRPTTLSGGQQQRVAIARALCKHPKIIIADEPTGNLDERNTVAVMDLLKQISKFCLVLLVTHEPKLVEYYADEALHIVDGKVVSRETKSADANLEIADSAVIYLKDLESHAVTCEACNIAYYTDDDKDISDLSLVVIKKNGKYFVKADSTAGLKITLVDKGSEVIVKDEHYEARTKEDKVEKLDLSIIKPIETGEKVPLIKTSDALKQSFCNLFSRGKNYKQLTGKIFNALMHFVVAFMICASIGMLFAINVVNPNMYTSCDKGIYKVNAASSSSLMDVEAIKAFAQEYDVELIPFVGTHIYTSADDRMLGGTRIHTPYASFTLSSNTIISSLTSTTSSRVWPDCKHYFSNQVCYMPIDRLKASDLLCGRMPETENEIVLDVNVYYAPDVKDSEKALLSYGYKGYEDMLGAQILYMGKYLTISGFSTTSAPTLFMSKSTYYECALRYLGEAYFERDDTVSDSPAAMLSDYLAGTTSNECAASVSYQNGVAAFEATMALKNTDLEAFYAEVIRLYLNDFTTNPINNDFSTYATTYTLLEMNKTTKSLFLLSDVDLDETETSIGTIQNGQLADKRTYQASNSENFGFIMIICIVLFVIAFLVQFFIQKASIIEKIRAIGILRSIGASKGNVYKGFACDIFAMICISSLPAFIICCFILPMMSVTGLVYFNFLAGMLSLILIVGLQFVMGMTPIWSLLRSTPTEINSKYDL